MYVIRGMNGTYYNIHDGWVALGAASIYDYLSKAAYYLGYTQKMVPGARLYEVVLQYVVGDEVESFLKLNPFEVRIK